MADGPISRIEWVEGQLREAILSGDLQPGERLLTAQLSERFQVSPTPLREALHRFAGEGLVEFVPQRGARVTTLSPQDCAELSELRSLLEPRCVVHAIEHGDDAWRELVVKASKELEGHWVADPHDPHRSESAYRSFYETLTAPCGSQRLRRQCTAVRDQAARYRLVTISRIDRDALASTHQRLVAAVLDSGFDDVTKAVVGEVDIFAEAYADEVREP